MRAKGHLPWCPLFLSPAPPAPPGTFIQRHAPCESCVAHGTHWRVLVDLAARRAEHRRMMAHVHKEMAVAVCDRFIRVLKNQDRERREFFAQVCCLGLASEDDSSSTDESFEWIH